VGRITPSYSKDNSLRSFCLAIRCGLETSTPVRHLKTGADLRLRRASAGTLRTQVPLSPCRWIHMLWRVSMNISRRRAEGWVPPRALSLIWIPTHILNWCEGLLFRKCLTYRRFGIRKRLRT